MYAKYSVLYPIFYYHSYKRHPLNGMVWGLGKMELKQLPALDIQIICQHFDTTVAIVPVFHRLLRDGEVFFGQQYTRVKVRNSYTVLYADNDKGLSYGQILYFVYVNDTAAAMMKMLNTLQVPDIFLPTKSIIPVQITSDIKLIDVDNIKEKCVFVDAADDDHYVIRFLSPINLD